MLTALINFSLNTFDKHYEDNLSASIRERPASVYDWLCCSSLRPFSAKWYFRSFTGIGFPK